MKSQEQIKKHRESLPIFQYKDKISQTVANHHICIITGDTGSGKSTQLPQYLMDCPIIKDSIQTKAHNVQQYASGKMPSIEKINVVTTQPRRMAAFNMAERVSMERGHQLGGQVGYTIRFEDKTSANTRLRYITDGIFVRQCISDPYLFKYHVVVLDQAHERSLYTDILFALVKKAVHYRKGTLKLIITSATLNTKTFSRYYDGCPVIQMHGKVFPVQVKYFSIPHSSRVDEAVKSTIRMHLHQGPGDILVFLTGSEECQSATRLCQEKLEDLMSKGREVPGMIMYQLYGALSNEDQSRVFQKTPEGIRKVVFSTNIAETSLTIDNIGFVIDCGFVKQKSYNPKTNMDSLVTVPISKVQAIQRKGRAGRTQQGRCLRLYSQKFYDQMRDYSLPEILRVSLNSVILTLKSMQIRDVINFEYMENPDKQAIFKALGDLFLLEALGEDGEITDIGIQMSKFPLDPQYSKALITANLFGIEETMIKLVSMLSTESVWKKVLRINQDEYFRFNESQKHFLAKTGDHQTYLNIYQQWVQCSDPNTFCDDNFLNFRALRQADAIGNQIHETLLNCDINRCYRYYKNDPNYEQYLKISRHYGKKLPSDYVRTLLRRCLSISFYYNTARLSANQNAYILNYPQGTVVTMDPSCALGLQGLDSPCVLFTQIGGTSSHGMMRTLSIIDPKWISSYLPKINRIDFFRLAGLTLKREKVVVEEKIETEEERAKRRKAEVDKKVEEARERYEARKKVKKN